MAGRLAGKTAFLTAAAAGIGRATALAYAREGAAVIATDVDVAGLDAVKKEQPQIETARVDVLDPAQCEAIGTRWPQINVLLNIAGFVHHGTILECSPEDWARSFDLNVNAMYRTIRSVLPHMIERGGGSIVNISSIASSIKGIPSRCVYGATKAAVIGLTGGIIGSLAAWGIDALANRLAYRFVLKPQGASFIDFFYLPPYLWLGAIAFALSVSILAALYPAARAARIDPVRALRHD